MKFDDYLKASEEQLELIEELQEIIKALEDSPADELTANRVIEILKRLGELREELKDIEKGEGEDFELLKRFYNMVGIHDERELLEELLKMILKGRIDVPQEIVLEQLKHNKEFEKTLRE
ncbi:hypothetical protein IPA_05330 [Ignicoccus pacificus DSM 13166]|uniref:Uncharacterized protein n=1 Tax=Ignicoccus pacificus DSM 13166 TaxID=940294 RepID=A0A977KBB3_9CREN|nr:hypothetical protein IPA_05330 [Ignicoccus pacificus DSM 13166]